MPNQMNRRKFLKIAGTTLLTATGLSFGGTVYASEIEPTTVELSRYTVTLPHLSPRFDGMTVMQISDIHMGEWISFDHVMDIMDWVNSLTPDLILLTGDMIAHFEQGTASEVKLALSRLRAPMGVIASLGNRDYWAGDTLSLNALATAKNVTLLRNANLALKRDDATLYIAGLDDVMENHHDLTRTLSGIPDGAAVIMMAHEPDYADTIAATGKVGLQLSGHSHGGQVRVPFYGALFLPEWGKKYDMGMYTINGMTLFTSRGVGMSPPHVRFNCRPEITLFTLKAP